MMKINPRGDYMSDTNPYIERAESGEDPEKILKEIFSKMQAYLGENPDPRIEKEIYAVVEMVEITDDNPGVMFFNQDDGALN